MYAHPTSIRLASHPPLRTWYEGAEEVTGKTTTLASRPFLRTRYEGYLLVKRLAEASLGIASTSPHLVRAAIRRRDLRTAHLTSRPPLRTWYEAESTVDEADRLVLTSRPPLRTRYE